MTVGNNIRWAQDIEDELIDLWANGLSLSQIGARLGMSRSAVSGKISRLKLVRRQPGRHRAKPKPAPSKDVPVVAAVAVASRELPEPVSLGTLLVDAQPFQCRWLAGDSAPRLICGHPTFGFTSYCEHHHRRVYHTIEPNKRKNPVYSLPARVAA